MTDIQITDEAKVQRVLLRAVDDIYAKFNALRVIFDESGDISEEAIAAAIEVLSDGTVAELVEGWCNYLLIDGPTPGEVMAERNRIEHAKPFVSTMRGIRRRKVQVGTAGAGSGMATTNELVDEYGRVVGKDNS